jgi:hypothetical protein
VPLCWLSGPAAGGVYEVRYRDLSGLLHTGPHTFTSKADAARYLALVEADLHRGTWADPKLGRITLAEWAKRWQQTTSDLRRPPAICMPTCFAGFSCRPSARLP